jgi:hypothetical protein
MKNLTALVGAGLLLAACATAAAVDPATEQERDQALRSEIICLKENALRMDDGRSDATTIAIALRSACAKEFHASQEVLGRQLSSAARRVFLQKSEDSFIQLSIRTVLDIRAQRTTR